MPPIFRAVRCATASFFYTHVILVSLDGYIKVVKIRASITESRLLSISVATLAAAAYEEFKHVKL